MTKPGRLIALYSSTPQQGKSVVAGELEQHGFRIFKFASALKDMLRSLFRSVGYGEMQIEAMVEGDQKETPIPELGGRTPRYLMRTLGTKWGREMVSYDLWVEILLLRVSSALQQGTSVVVDDMRFPNEWKALQALGAQMVRVVRPGLNQGALCESEGQLDGCQFDRVLVNESDVSYLQSIAYISLLNPVGDI